MARKIDPPDDPKWIKANAHRILAWDYVRYQAGFGGPCGTDARLSARCGMSLSWTLNIAERAIAKCRQTLTTNREMTFVGDSPGIVTLTKAYNDTVSDLDFFKIQCRENYDDRRCLWPGKNRQLKKAGADAFPWQGASDVEAPVIQEKIRTFTALCVNALRRSTVRAYPVEGGEHGPR